jgi:branched-chain amino acid transport system permease protein
MDQFIQLTFAGLTNGAIYALVALGFVLIFKASDVVNFAQGELLLLGAYISFFFIGQLGWLWPLGVVAAIGVSVLAALLIERTVLRPLIGEPIISVIMATVGLASIIRALVNVIWGTVPYSFPAFIPDNTVTILGAVVSMNQIFAIVLALLFLGLFTLFFRRSSEGIAMRAVADDQQAALSMGISVKHIFGLAWSISAATATVAGILLANIIGVSGNIATIGLRVFPVVILGGLDSIPGAIVGGFIIGLLEAYTGGFIGRGLNQVIPFIVLVIVLMVRPYGLFGQKVIERV